MQARKESIGMLQKNCLEGSSESCALAGRILIAPGIILGQYYYILWLQFASGVTSYPIYIFFLLRTHTVHISCYDNSFVIKLHCLRPAPIIQQPNRLSETLCRRWTWWNTPVLAMTSPRATTSVSCSKMEMVWWSQMKRNSKNLNQLLQCCWSKKSLNLRKFSEIRESSWVRHGRYHYDDIFCGWIRCTLLIVFSEQGVTPTLYMMRSCDLFIGL